MVKTGVNSNWGSEVTGYGNSINVITSVSGLEVKKTTFKAYKEIDSFINDFNKSVIGFKEYTRIQAAKMGKVGHNKVVIDTQGSHDFLKGASLIGK